MQQGFFVELEVKMSHRDQKFMHNTGTYWTCKYP